METSTSESRQPSTVLVVDDERGPRLALQLILQREFLVVTAQSGEEALEILKNERVEAVTLDLKMPGLAGQNTLSLIRSVDPDLPVIIMTAHSDLDSAVAAYEGGAFEYLPKPFDVDQAVELIRRALGESQREQAVLEPVGEVPEILGKAPAMQEVFRAIGRLSQSSATVLITGESGTGKELVARALHRHSTRATKPFVAINTAAMPKDLLESELFGHERGAFTGAQALRRGRFEQAEGGTLFLDEIGDMSQSTQAKILRVLQEHEFERLGGTRTLRVDVRLMAATNRDLPAMVAAGQFREDLYYRLNVVSIEMPPLRERKDDIVPLAHTFIRKFSAELKKKIDGLEPDAQKLLMRYNWPGNIRELENAIERAMLLADGTHISMEDLRLGDTGAAGSPRESASIIKIPPTGIPLEEIERLAIVEALKMSNWVQKDAAELLGISPRVMNYKIKILAIEIPRSRRVIAEPVTPVTS